MNEAIIRDSGGYGPTGGSGMRVPAGTTSSQTFSPGGADMRLSEDIQSSRQTMELEAKTAAAGRICASSQHHGDARQSPTARRVHIGKECGNAVRGVHGTRWRQGRVH